MLALMASVTRGTMPAETHLFPCLKDNYGVLLHDTATGATAAIDAPEAEPIEAALRQTGWRLTDILVTHHHADHTQGIPALKQHHRCRVVGPRAEAGRISTLDEAVNGGFSGPLKRQLMGKFARAFFTAAGFDGDRHDGLPLSLLKVLSASTFAAAPLPKEPKPKKVKAAPAPQPSAVSPPAPTDTPAEATPAMAV